MDFQERKNIRLNSACYNQNGIYFITICTKDRKKILSRISVGTPVPGCPQIQLLPYGVVADKYIRQMDAFYTYLSMDKYVIMPDHIHFLISVCDASGRQKVDIPTKQTSVVARFVGTFKRFCNSEYGENIWQERYYDHIVRNQQDYDDIWQYIENNPRNKFLQERGDTL